MHTSQNGILNTCYTWTCDLPVEIHVHVHNMLCRCTCTRTGINIYIYLYMDTITNMEKYKPFTCLYMQKDMYMCCTRILHDKCSLVIVSGE